MAFSAAPDEFPDGFIADAATSLRVIETLTTDAAQLAATPLDPAAQERMRRSLDRDSLGIANEAARRIARMPRAIEGLTA